jgi:hypothetical protein
LIASCLLAQATVWEFHSIADLPHHFNAVNLKPALRVLLLLFTVLMGSGYSMAELSCESHGGDNTGCLPQSKRSITYQTANWAALSDTQRHANGA